MGDQLYDQGDRYIQLSSAGTTVVKTTEARLIRVVLNTFVGGGSLSIYNSTAAVASQLVAVVGTGAAGAQGSYYYNVALSGGLTLVVVGTPNFTVTYN